MTNMYLAATFSRAEEMRGYRDHLEKLGYNITSRWIDTHYPVMKTEEVNKDLLAARVFAVEDVVDLMKAQVMILFTGMPSTTGGRHTELGVALAFGKQVIIIGPRENVFQAYEGIIQFNTWEDFMKEIAEQNASR